MSEALKKQVGGNHYKTMAIQPIEYAMANELGPCEFSILKYISRKKGPSRVEDLLKARHFLDTLIEDEKKNDVKAVEKPVDVANPHGILPQPGVYPQTMRWGRYPPDGAYATATDIYGNTFTPTTGASAVRPTTKKLYTSFVAPTIAAYEKFNSCYDQPDTED